MRISRRRFIFVFKKKGGVWSIGATALVKEKRLNDDIEASVIGLLRGLMAAAAAGRDIRHASDRSISIEIKRNIFTDDTPIALKRAAKKKRDGNRFQQIDIGKPFCPSENKKQNKRR